MDLEKLKRKPQKKVSRYEYKAGSKAQPFASTFQTICLAWDVDDSNGNGDRMSKQSIIDVHGHVGTQGQDVSIDSNIE